MKTAYYERKKAISVRASLEDFNGDVAKWKDSFYGFIKRPF